MQSTTVHSIPTGDTVVTTVLDPAITADTLRDALKESARRLARTVGDWLPAQDLYVVSAVEDADTFAAPFLDALGPGAGYACFWHETFDLDFHPGGETRIAPIVHRYRDLVSNGQDTLVVLSSLASDEAVIRSQILAVMPEMAPRRILLVSPVAVQAVLCDLRRRMSGTLSEAFVSVALATVDMRDDQVHAMRPMHERLGMGSVDEKNAIMPELVMARRKARARPT